jgi:hypothetical protein
MVIQNNIHNNIQNNIHNNKYSESTVIPLEII